ncbi:MAG: tryptophan-rich sensory protein [Clostridia bacterium]|nr:tryptophan-rich sensory protein [Clostridia bacterium]
MKSFWLKIKDNLASYVIAIAIPLGVGLLAAYLTMENMNIYSKINTPPLSPPALLFPIVWTVLYILMGVSSAMVYNRREAEPIYARRGLGYYAMSLIANFAWSIIFFNVRAFGIAFLWLVLLLYLIIRTILCYFKVSKVAALLQIPYAVWVAFAGYLNLGIIILN